MTAQQFGGNVIDVAAAVVLKRDAEFLLTQRPAGRPYAGYWEFPGGKLLPGEAPEEAVRRELKEELDIDVVEARRWITRYYEYPHANVRLHFFRIGRWEGDVRALEGQAFAWQRATQTTVGPMLPANAPVLRALALPSIYAISNAHQVGIDSFLARMKAAFERGLRLIQIREKEMQRAELRELTVRALDLAASYRAKVLLNSTHANLAKELPVHGMQLTAADLMKARARPDFDLCAASCHDEAELMQAHALELDFVLLGPVNDSHSGAGMGWQKFAELIHGYSLPVYAIGGVLARDLEKAERAGAQGVAMIRGAWSG